MPIGWKGKREICQKDNQNEQLRNPESFDFGKIERRIRMKIYLVRHGEVDSNLKKIYNLEDDLNQTGIKQAENLKEKIQNLEYDIVYCSPLLRAKHTADIINFRKKKILFVIGSKREIQEVFVGKPYECTN